MSNWIKKKHTNCFKLKTNVFFSGNVTDIPTIRVTSVKQHSGGHPAMLVCSAFNFYPKQIRMTWLRNQKEVTAGVSYSEVMPDGDWYYQIHSYLEYTPTHGEKITCAVEHLSVSEPILAIWGKFYFAMQIIHK